MQAVAAEMNPLGDRLPPPRRHGHALRWFTPVAEVALCGHATLASAHALWSVDAAAGRPIDFGTLSGVPDGLARRRLHHGLPGHAGRAGRRARRARRGPGARPALDRPQPASTGSSRLASPEEVAGARPDIAALAAVGGRGVILTAAGGRDGADVTSRYFAPAFGIPEDPASACPLRPGPWPAVSGERLVRHQAPPPAAGPWASRCGATGCCSRAGRCPCSRGAWPPGRLDDQADRLPWARAGAGVDLPGDGQAAHGSAITPGSCTKRAAAGRRGGPRPTGPDPAPR